MVFLVILLASVVVSIKAHKQAPSDRSGGSSAGAGSTGETSRQHDPCGSGTDTYLLLTQALAEGLGDHDVHDTQAQTLETPSCLYRA
ncbi:hypothetical protein F4680DRAFT_410414, partial [Xylaria scruposa]